MLQLAVAVAGDHRRRPREEVPEVVAQLALVALAEGVERDVAVLAERDGPRDPEPHGIDAVFVDQLERVDHVAERLRDRASAEVEVAVHEQLPRHVVAGREQERGPVDAVEAEDVLREQVPDARPQVRQVLARTRVLERAAVVDERVRPDVGDLLRIPRNRDPPGLPGPADREVAQATGDEALRLVRPKRRQDEVGPLLVELEQPILVGGEPEEPVLLLDPLGLDAVVGALAVDELVLALEGLAADAVEARRRRPGRRRRCRRSAAGTPGRTPCGRHRSSG